MKSLFLFVVCLMAVGCGQTYVMISDELTKELVAEEVKVFPNQEDQVLTTISPVQGTSDPITSSAIGRVAVERKKDKQILCFLVIPYRPIPIGTEVKAYQIRNQRATGGQTDDFFFVR